MPRVETIPLKRSGTGYLIENFVYAKSYQAKKAGVPCGPIFLKCQDAGKGCKARASYYPDKEKGRVTNPVHSHEPPFLPGMKFRGQILEEVKKPKNSRASLSELYTTAKNELLQPITNRAERDEFDKKLPKYSTVQPSLSQARSDVAPPAPKTRTDIDTQFITDAFTTPDGDPFLLRDTGPNDDGRILILGLPKADLSRFSQVTRIAMDGTFWSAPSVYKQVFTIHFEVYGHMYPALLCLLPDKLETTYDKLLWNVKDILLQQGIQLSRLRTVISDFEMGIINSVNKQFGPIHQGCFFHFAQAIYRKVAKMFGSAYKTDANFREAIRMFIALGHVPAPEKHACYQILYNHYIRDARIRQFADEYFYPTWFGRYPTYVWDWFNVDRRTHNSIEGWHRGLKKFLVTPHLSLYRFLTLMLEEFNKKSHALAELIRNPTNPRKDAKWEAIDAQYQKKMVPIHAYDAPHSSDLHSKPLTAAIPAN